MNTLLSPDTVEVLRWFYMALSMLVAGCFATTIVMRWDELHWGERLVRIGLVCEHTTFIYSGYILWSHHLPAPITVLLFTLWLLVIVAGFALWTVDVVTDGQ